MPPKRTNEAAGHDSPGEHWGEHWDEHWTRFERVINLGFLASGGELLAVGPFRDEFFIDYVERNIASEPRQRVINHSPESTSCRMPHRLADGAQDVRDEQVDDQSWTGSPVLHRKE